MAQNRTAEINIEDIYFTFDAGYKFIADRIGLDQAGQETLKKAVSERLCLEEALVVSQIPACYLFELLNGLTPDDRENEVIKHWIGISKSKSTPEQLTIKNPPHPFRLDGDGPYFQFYEEEHLIRLLLLTCKAFNDYKIGQALKTTEMTQKFCYGEQAVLLYLIPPPPGLNMAQMH